MARQRKEPSPGPLTSVTPLDTTDLLPPPAAAAVVVSARPLCEGCLYWKAMTEFNGIRVGECRFNPPFLVDPTRLTSLGPVLRFGLTPADFSCGQHSPR